MCSPNEGSRGCEGEEEGDLYGGEDVDIDAIEALSLEPADIGRTIHEVPVRLLLERRESSAVYGP